MMLELQPLQIKKIAILRALQLGDLLCAVPAFRALRHAYPDAEITLLGLPWASSFVERFTKYFDCFIHFPGFDGLPEQEYHEDDFNIFLHQVRNEKFDLVLQMQGNGNIVNTIVSVFKSANVAGFYNEHCYKPSDLFMLYPGNGTEVSRHIKLMEYLGIESKGDELEFPLLKSDYSVYENLGLTLPEKKYICIHPGSRGNWRQWPPKYFAAVADICIECGYIVVVTGIKEESDITNEMIKCMCHPAIDLTGRTSVGSLAILLKNAFLLVANCTGVSHMASATKTPSVIISMDGEPERWGPVNRNIHTVIDCKQHQNFDKVILCVKEHLDLSNIANNREDSSGVMLLK